jgi:hypothetical protein
MKRIKAKLGNMRKEEEFIVYPQSAEKDVLRLQSDHRCLIVRVSDGRALLSKYVANYPNFMHCNPMSGGTVVTVSQEVIAECLAAQPKSGDAIGGGVYIA